MRSRRLGLLSRAAALTALFTISSVVELAHAADPPPQDIAQARDLGGQAQAAFDAGNFQESEKLWLAAQNLYPGAATITLGLARTQVKLGKLVLAQESYNRIIREQNANPSSLPAFKDAAVSAQNEVGAVSARVANVVIQIDGAPPNVTVTIDGQPVPAATLGLKRPVDPGPHKVKAEAPGYTTVETGFDVKDAGLAETKLKMEKGPGGPTGPAGGDNTTGPSVDTGKSSNKTLAIVAFGVGGVGLVFGAITGILAIGKHGDLADQCPEGKCTSDKSSDVDSYKTMGTLSTVGFIVAGVGVAAGAVLWFTAPKESASTATTTLPKTAQKKAVTWQPYVSLGGAGVTGRF